MSVNYWIQFFKDAGIPSSVAKSYALLFEDNRISKEMLLDLNRDILSDMGIKVMGDAIGILKHAKVVHSQEARRKDLGGGASAKSLPSSSSSSSKIPTAHSTSPGLASAAVSTTTATKKKSKPPVVSESPADSWTPELVTTADQFDEDDNINVPAVEGETVIDAETLEVLLAHPNLSQSDRAVLETALVQSGLLPPESPPPHSVSEPELQLTFTTSGVRSKRPLTMYSDDPTEYSPPKQPRVVVLPNKEQDIYTTTALRKAVATVTALGAASGLATTIQGNEQMSPEKLSQRRLIEATGLLEPLREKGHAPLSSVFSRLDQQKPSTTTNIHLAASISKPSTRVTLDTSKERTIVSNVGASSSSSTFVSPSTIRITKPVTQSRTLSSSSSSTSTSTSSSRLSGRLSVKDGSSSRISSSSTLQLGSRGTLASDKMTSRLGPAPSSKERLGLRDKEVSSSSSSPALTIGRRSTDKPLSGRLGVRTKDPVSPSNHPATSSKVSRTNASQEPVSTKQHSMVADEYEYQTLRQLDVRSRLEKKERETRARRGGPLAGRLAKHHVFGRLE